MDTVQNPVGPKAPRALFHAIYLLHCDINHRGSRLPVPSWFQQWTVKWKICRGLWTRCIKIWRDICLAQHQPLQTHHFTFCLWTKWGEGRERGNPSHCGRGQEQEKGHIIFKPHKPPTAMAYRECGAAREIAFLPVHCSREWTWTCPPGYVISTSPDTGCMTWPSNSCKSAR